MFDSVPTRAERITAVLAIAAGLGVVATAALGYGLATVALLFVALTCGTIAKARVSLDSLVTFGVRKVPENDPDAVRYRERRQREGKTIQEGIERLDSQVAARPRLEKLFFLGLALIGVGALAAVPIVAGDDRRTAGYLLVVALIAFNASAVGYAASKIGDDDADDG